MKNERELILKINISVCGADPVPFESLSEKQLEEIRNGWDERIGKSLSAYYSEHPKKYQEFAKSARQQA